MSEIPDLRYLAENADLSVASEGETTAGRRQRERMLAQREAQEGAQDAALAQVAGQREMRRLDPEGAAAADREAEYRQRKIMLDEARMRIEEKNMMRAQEMEARVATESLAMAEALGEMNPEDPEFMSNFLRLRAQNPNALADPSTAEIANAMREQAVMAATAREEAAEAERERAEEDRKRQETIDSLKQESQYFESQKESTPDTRRQAELQREIDKRQADIAGKGGIRVPHPLNLEDFDTTLSDAAKIKDDKARDEARERAIYLFKSAYPDTWQNYTERFPQLKTGEDNETAPPPKDGRDSSGGW